MEQNNALLNSPGLRSGIKMAILAGLVLVLIVPLLMIGSLVSEREARHRSVVEELVTLNGGRQVVHGPLVVVPVTVPTIDERGVRRVERLTITLAPESLTAGVVVSPEVRRRGIYTAPVYVATVTMEGTFSTTAAAPLAPPGATIAWDEATLVVGVPGVSGLRTQPFVAVDGDELRVTSSGFGGGSTRGIEAPIPDAASVETRTFAIELQLSGGGSLHVVPTALRSRVTIESSWTNPSFSGDLLPSTREIDANGFDAVWETTALGMGLPEAWLDTGFDRPYASRIGVELYQPVGHYQQVERSVKYGVLFVLLPFVALFLIETFTGARIHPVQYLLVAAAKIVFYLLLLSLSEHIAAVLAYWVAAAATTALVAVYAASIVRERRHGVLLGAMVGAEYLFLFVALQSEDYALLIGSVGLFAITAAVMLLTRRVDWYGPGSVSDSAG